MHMKRYVIEFIGTMFLVLTIGLAVANAGAIAPLAIGAVLMVFVYAGAHVSGAHYNPAISIGLWVAGKLPSSELVKYIVSQILWWATAAWLVFILWANGAWATLTAPILSIIIAELLFTFALVWVVLNVATTKSSEGMSYYGLAIGFTVVAGAYAVGSISGAAFNPAVVIGNAIDGLLAWNQIWMHLVASVAGGLLAGGLFKSLKIK